MGRHRRSAAGSAAKSRATGVTQTHGSHADSHRTQDAHTETLPTIGIAPYLNPEAYADSVARSQEYLYADGGYAHGDTAVFAGDGFTPDGGAHRPGANRAGAGRRRKRRVATPVKSGLLGVSAAVAIGTVAVATGVVPGIDGYRLGGGSGGSGDKVQAAAGSPTNSASEQGGTSGAADDDRDSAPTSRDAGRPAAPSTPAAPSPSVSASSAAPTKTAPTKTAPQKPESTPSKTPETTPSKSRAATKAPAKSEAPVTVSAETQAAAEVLKLVNEERAKVGCSPVSANSSLSDLAEKFSDDMAARGFFDHTDPDGATPWDRAAKAGISGLGGENIARGQADAAAVMEAWMNSPGHRANILNCDFKTLGVGVHFGAGGPWWTQDFGY
ncbi:CAP domain-containing protein [Streptomyces sp. NBC_00199]|uniref:CAP domain-containing protein n=1 Tax=Streptomyces sp. NBC_00199 TaxID=2975678 RepID=UPI00224CEBC3|nr:CAP domain-containing protein [Streptomyces sp. NBC_00199]MCX5267953.1 CAP domain-containing protein [Streptomyces sp. NBC_00199]